MILSEAFEALARRESLREADLPAMVRTQLAQYGVTPTAGFYTVADRELLDGAAIRAELSATTTTWLRRLEIIACTASTNTDLLDAAQEGSIDGVARTAEVQTDGRGRRGRSWVSPFGRNIALSIGVEVDQPPAALGAASLGVGLAVAVYLSALGVANVQLKWPNDVLIDGRKVGGILIELANATQPAVLVVGVGVNVNAAPGLDVTGDYRATRLSEHMDSPLRNRLVANLLNEIVGTVKEFETRGFGSMKKEWQKRDALLGQEVVLQGVTPPLRGIGAGIDDEGAYLIQTEAGVERAIGGELSLRVIAHKR